MVRAIDKIEKDIAELEETTRNTALQLYSIYFNYLTELGKAVRQQLILASYHICTQGYAESFLKLSLSQRQQLQQEIRKLSKKAQEMLLAALCRPVKESLELPMAENRFLTAVNPLFHQGAEQKAEQPPENLEMSNLVSNPEQLAQWQKTLEIALAKILQTTSQKANQLLQQAGILPPKLPETILEAAARAEAGEAAVAGPPNLINVLIETENAEESQKSTITQLIAIHLRLPEIEFADAKVMAGRSQIRQLTAKLNKIKRDYQKKQRERAIAEAEAAWRATWVEDD